MLPPEDIKIAIENNLIIKLSFIFALISDK